MKSHQKQGQGKAALTRDNISELNFLIHTLTLARLNLSEDEFFSLSDKEQLEFYAVTSHIVYGESDLFTIDDAKPAENCLFGWTFLDHEIGKHVKSLVPSAEQRQDALHQVVKDCLAMMTHQERQLGQRVVDPVGFSAHFESSSSFSSSSLSTLTRPDGSLEQKRIVRSSSSFTVSSPSFNFSREVVRVSEVHLRVHPFDMLEEGREYKVANFIGACPEMAGASMVTKNGETPVWRHQACTMTVGGTDAQGKHVRLKAMTAPGNCDYGVSGAYELEITLKKDVNGQVTCTSIKGISGKLVIPAIVGKTLGVFSWLTRGAAWDSVASYNTGKVQQSLPVTLTCNQDGTIQLIAAIDPSVLNLEGAAYYMLGVLKGLRLASKAVLEGSVDVGPSLQHRRDDDRDPGSSLSLSSSSSSSSSSQSRSVGR